MCFSSPQPVQQPAPIVTPPTPAVMASPEKTAAENSSTSIDAARRGKRSLRIDLGGSDSSGSGLSIPT